MIVLIAGQSNAADLAPRLRKLLPDVHVRECVKHGYALIKKCAMPDEPEAYWLHTRCLESLARCGPANVLWWIQGECEALNGCTEAEYTHGLRDLHAAMYDAWGTFKFVISPVGATAPRYRFARPVLAAQYCWQPVGPEYYDLLEHESGCVIVDTGRGPESYDILDRGIHMDNAGKDEFVQRMTNYLYRFRLVDTLANVA